MAYAGCFARFDAIGGQVMTSYISTWSIRLSDDFQIHRFILYHCTQTARPH